jgi:flagellar assembly factor FliW
MKNIETTRFGNIEMSEEHTITFKDGMIGFPRLKKYVLIESNSTPMLMWLQSIDAPEVAFPVMEPWFFRRDYKAPLSEADRLSIDFEDSDILKTLVVLTIPGEMMRMTVNLKAPVVVNIEKATAAQIIIQDKSLEVRVPAHEAFNKAVSNYQNHLVAFDSEGDEESFNAVDVKARKTSKEAQ